MKGHNRPIRVYGDPVLTEKTKPVTKITEEVTQLIADMKETMLAQQGLGLSANQIGVPLSVIVVNPRGAGIDSEPYAVINPELVKAEGLIEREEGCLSIPGLSEVLARPVKVIVKGLNEEGKPIEIKAEGLLARVFCHEIDHLNGIFFVNRLGKTRFALVKPHLDRLKKD
jgi:peptide deformylase|uniref:Peptide deformylase n=1 Tax=candidate division WOR-3 bacterium TaxID=2052148 RepID=A0A7C6EBS2_UNCW3